MNGTVGIIAEKLREKGWHMAAAESCTGGMIAAACTDVPGSSEWFDGGVVTYTVPWKCRLLDIPMHTIDEKGVVSAETASAMASGLQRMYGVQAAVSTTGIAGPTGAEPGKPVGTVFVAVALRDSLQVFECHFSGGREEVRRQAARFALEKLAAELCKPHQVLSRQSWESCENHR